METEWKVALGLLIALWGSLVTLYVALKSDSKDGVKALRNELIAKIESVGTKVDDLKQEVKQITSALIERGIQSVAADIANKSIGDKPAETNSPTTLNPKGQDIAKYLRAEPIVEKYAGKISIPDDADRLAIQSICFAFAFDSLMKVVNKEEAKIIRDTIYREGGEGKSIDIFTVFGILFRNHHLKERGFPVPEYIKPSEAASQ